VASIVRHCIDAYISSNIGMDSKVPIPSIIDIDRGVYITSNIDIVRVVYIASFFRLESSI
jgi:hypothetical protein